MATISLTAQYYTASVSSTSITNARYLLYPGTSTSYYATIPASSTINLYNFGLDYFKTKNTVNSYELYITVYNTWQTITIFGENDTALTSVDKAINGDVLPTGWSSTTSTTNVQRFLISSSLLANRTVTRISVTAPSDSTCRFYGARLYVNYTSTNESAPSLPYGYYRTILSPRAATFASTVGAGTTNCYSNTTNVAPTTIASVPTSSTTNSHGFFYLGNFNFNLIPSNAKVVKWRIRVKAFSKNLSKTFSFTSETIPLPQGTVNLESGKFYLINKTNDNYYLNLYSRDILSEEDSYKPDPELYDYCHTNLYTTQVMGYERDLGGQLMSWDELKSYGDNLYLGIILSSATAGEPCFLTLYGAEIEVIYYYPPNPTITINSIKSHYGNNSNLESTILLDDEAFTGTKTLTYNTNHSLTITPPSAAGGASITVTENDINITNKLLKGTSAELETNLGTYTLISGGFYESGATYFSGLTGAGVNNTQVTNNYYSSSSSTKAIFTYDMGITVPSNSTITKVWLEVNGHAENASNVNEYMCVQLKSGDTYFSNQFNFKSAGTSNTTQIINATTIPTRAQLSAMKVECTLGYYGGAINGATLHVEYLDPSGNIYHYSFTALNNIKFDITGGGGYTHAPINILKIGTGSAKIAPFGYDTANIVKNYEILLNDGTPGRTQTYDIKITPDCRMRPVFLKIGDRDVTNQLIHNTYTETYLENNTQYNSGYPGNGQDIQYLTFTEYNVLKGNFVTIDAEKEFRKDVTQHGVRSRSQITRSGSSEHLLISFEVGVLLPPTVHIESICWGGYIEPYGNDPSTQYFNFRIMSGNKSILDFKNDYPGKGLCSDYTVGTASYAITHSSVLTGPYDITPEDVANLTFEIEVGEWGGTLFPGVNIYYKDQGDNYVYTLQLNDNYNINCRVDTWHEVMRKEGSGWAPIPGIAHGGGNYYHLGTGCLVYKNNQWQDAINLIQTFKNASTLTLCGYKNCYFTFDRHGDTIYTNTPLDDLKQYITVYEVYYDQPKKIIPDNGYEIEGTLTEGISTITVYISGSNGSYTMQIPNIVAAPTT